ncbi:MAG: DUF2490 domain-containing protein [Myxococcales bacterium]|nr:DUF2490 domain-containing protein [Myxococcales bacterium]
MARATDARADFEFWSPIEVRVPIVRTPSPTWPRVDLRLIGEPRFAVRFNGLEQLFFRAGPVVYFTPWMFVGAHGTVLADALVTPAGMPTRLEEEVRAELEPNFFGRLGPITLASRNRLEYRWRQTFQRLRFRTQLRVNLAPVGWVVMPFVQDELLFDLWDTRVSADAMLPAGVSPTPGFNQNRTMVGVGVQLTSSIRLDVSALVRVRQQPGMAEWAVDVGPWIGLFVDVPKLDAPAATTTSARTITDAPAATGVAERR